MTELLSFWADARAEMDRHGLTDWKLVYSGTRGNALGTTTHGTRTITLSAPHIEDGTREQGWDTVLHEIAHALCDHTEGHGRAWQRMARKIGANPSRVSSHGSPSEADSYPVVGTCLAGHTYGRSRMPAKGRVYSCQKCARQTQLTGTIGMFGSRITWKRNSAATSATVKAAVAKHGAVKASATLRVGSTIRINTPSLAKWHGRVGVVYKVGRTKYVVNVADYPRLINLPADCVQEVMA